MSTTPARIRLAPSGQAAAGHTVLAQRGGYELLLIPGGAFTMGSSNAEQKRWAGKGEFIHFKHLRRRFKHESPQHEVTLRSFYLGRHPVTNEQYATYLQANPDAMEPNYWRDPNFNQPDQPVMGVSWEDAKAYCDWAGLVLPSEAQWEYACRAGSRTAFWSGDREEDLARVGWYRGNSDERLHPVGGKPANPFGLHDMHGSVSEWCQDWWHASYKGAPTDGSAWLQCSSEARVSRGGSFGTSGWSARSAYRGDDGRLPSFRGAFVGFRPASVITE